jgi:hypothetical protein
MILITVNLNSSAAKYFEFETLNFIDLDLYCTKKAIEVSSEHHKTFR